MVCDGQNASCDRRRELLSQLKCIVSSMETRKPCEWDEGSTPQVVCCPAPGPCSPSSPCCPTLYRSKSFELRASVMIRCECPRRNGLQDRCLIMDCLGRPECMTKLYPICCPGQKSLLKTTDFGDASVALKKYMCASDAAKNHLTHYCRLTCGDPCPPCPPFCPTPVPSPCGRPCPPPCPNPCKTCPPMCPPKSCCPSPCPKPSCCMPSCPPCGPCVTMPVPCPPPACPPMCPAPNFCQPSPPPRRVAPCGGPCSVPSIPQSSCCARPPTLACPQPACISIC